MFSHVEKLKKTSIRAHRTTKKKLLDAIKSDYLDHIMATKFFIDHAVENYKNYLTNHKITWSFKRPLKIDFSGEAPVLKVSKESYSITNRDKSWIAADALNHSLSLYLIWCFEEFETFLKNIYAFIGFMDNANWQGNDFGNKILREIKMNTFSEYQLKIKESNIFSTEMIKRIKMLYPIIGKWEITGVHNLKNLHWRIAYITQIRHYLVHKAGTVDDINTFEQKLRNKFGVGNNNVFNVFLEKMRQYYITVGTQSNISLFDANSSSSKVENYDTLIDTLQLDAEFIHEAIRRNI